MFVIFKGIISGLELQLTERPIYGLWTIKVIVDVSLNNLLIIKY